jgi:TRAP-type mannitol/chloroaromatic compound transport system substrate-binding protein
MSNTYTWSFPTLSAYPSAEGETDVVFTVHWVLNGTDGNGHSGSVYGTVPVTYTAGGPFTPYANLTEAQVTAWTTEGLGADRVAELQANIDNQIQQQVSPTVVDLPPPWAA